MEYFKFPMPLDPEKSGQSSLILTSLIEYIRIILKRIKEEKKLYARYIGSDKFIPYLLETLVLDIKTLYLYAKIYLDKFSQYIIITFFPEIDTLLNECDNFKAHADRLRNIPESNLAFQEYREFVFNYRINILFRISFVRNHMITHRNLDIFESYGYDNQNNIFYIYFQKEKDPFRIDKNLKNNIINLGRKYGINKTHDKQKVSEFFYLDSILEKIEINNIIIKRKDEERIYDYRKKLGFIVSKHKVFQLIYEFSEGITKILKKHFPNISQYHVWRFQL